MGTFRKIYNELNGIEPVLRSKDFAPHEQWDPEYKRALAREKKEKKNPKPITAADPFLWIGEKLLDLLLDFIIILPKLIIAFAIGFIGMAIYDDLKNKH